MSTLEPHRLRPVLWSILTWPGLKVSFIYTCMYLFIHSFILKCFIFLFYLIGFAREREALIRCYILKTRRYFSRILAWSTAWEGSVMQTVSLPCYFCRLMFLGLCTSPLCPELPIAGCNQIPSWKCQKSRKSAVIPTAVALAFSAVWQWEV